MAAVDSKIIVADYNGARTTIVRMIGPSSTGAFCDYGYGAYVRSSAVTDSNKVSINEWGNLRYDLANIAKHQTGSVPSYPIVDEGDTIKYNATTEPVERYINAANSLVPTRFNVNDTITRNVDPSTGLPWTKSLSTTWFVQLVQETTFSWPTAQEARHWFNSGGTIRISSSFSPSSTTPQNTSWVNLLQPTATIPRVFGGGTPLLGRGSDGRNFYRATTTNQLWDTMIATGAYAANDWTLYSRTNVNNINGEASTLTIRSEWNDDHQGLGVGNPPAGYDLVNGTMYINIEISTGYSILTPPGSPPDGGGVLQQTEPTVTLGDIIKVQ